jgi:large subunit ribosomal protein L1
MAKNKRMTTLYQGFEKETVYPIKEALAIVKKAATAKFDETIELHFRLGIDPKKGDQQVRGTAVLPHSFGEAKKVAAFVAESKEKEAKEAGADVIYTVDNMETLKKTGKIDFDIAVATPDMMKNLAPLARMLGPKGLMPSPKNDTITTNLKKTIDELKKGKIAFKNDDSANLHQGIGKVSTDDKALSENFTTFLDALQKAKPEGTKGSYIKGITVCSTMGPGVKVEIK